MKNLAKDRRARSPERRNGARAAERTPVAPTVAGLSGFPFRSFAEFQEAVADKKFGIGVNPLAAAEWAADQEPDSRKIIVSSLSVLLIVAALASILVALVFANYWLLLALPVQALVFYLSNSNTNLSLWVTVAGAVSLLVFFDLLLNQLPTAATLVAYGGLTFACVRAANSLTNQSFRKALRRDEELFVVAFKNRACTVRNTKTKEVFEYEGMPEEGE